MKQVYLDIETYGKNLQNTVVEMIRSNKVKPHANTKDELKKVQQVIEKREKLFIMDAANPWYNRIFCMTIRISSSKHPKTFSIGGRCLTNKQSVHSEHSLMFEKLTIQAMVDQLMLVDSEGPWQLVMWNGLDFDVPTLKHRMADLQIGKKYGQFITGLDVIDLMLKMKSSWQDRMFSLDLAAAAYGIEQPTEHIKGSNIPQLVKDGTEESFLKIERHCEEDTRMLQELFEKVGPYFTHSAMTEEDFNEQRKE